MALEAITIPVRVWRVTDSSPAIRLSARQRRLIGLGIRLIVGYVAIFHNEIQISRKEIIARNY
jgi:hypothetical protein